MSAIEHGISFVSGAAFGLTSVTVGQPLDTIKTRMQARPSNLSSGIFETGKSLYQTEGVRGLYRGGLPLFVGGAMFRSAQFGFYDATLHALRPNGDADKPERIGGVIDWHVLAAGFVGGVGRGIVEGPFEFVKVRRQVEQPWSFRNVYSGSGITILRNSFLFSSFVLYIDLSKLVIPGGLSPFWTGAICANMAWLTVWPLDVVKSQSQSGNYTGMSYWELMKTLFKSGKMYRGLMPGLARSSIANGCSMTVYHYVKNNLTEQLVSDDKEW